MINEAYAADISKKVRAQQNQAMRDGEFVGARPPYGYRKAPDNCHRLLVNEDTAPIVRQIFQWTLDGVALNVIVKRLNESGVMTPGYYHASCGLFSYDNKLAGSGKWQTWTVGKILADQVYTGDMVQGKHTNIGHKQVVTKPEDWIVVRNTHEPLIDEDTFRAVQRMAEDASSTYQERLGRHDGLGKIPNILRGLIYCADCGRTMTRYKNVTNKGTHLYYNYICRTHASNPISCPKKNLHETELTEILWDTLRREIALAENLDKLVRQYSRSTKAVSQRAIVEHEVTTVKQALSRAKMLYDSLYQNYADKLMTEREYTEMKQKYRSDMERAQARLEALEQQQKDTRHQTTENPWLTTCIQYRQETELTEGMAHALIERVEVDAGNRVSIVLRYQDEYRALLQFLVSEGEAVSA